jgi:hypothetical protein
MQRFVLAIAAITFVLSPTLVRAQQDAELPVWDPSTVRTLKASVLGMMTTRRDLLVLRVKDDAGNHRVMLGPKSNLDPALTKLAAATEVEITGSVVKRGPKQRELYLAQTVKVGDKVYKVRDEQGKLLTKSGSPAPPPKK